MRTQRGKTLGIIKVLPESLSARIAAGEVVERPASVVKELVENALDADATRINVEVRNGGRSLIRVDDDGVGIPSSQVEVAFERFATSKIDDRTDLAQIETLGFRGEALPSIASVSDIEATSKTMSEASGSRLIIRLGQPDKIEKHGRPQGTSLFVRNLFQNVPARMRFLASQGAEVARIHQMVSRYALIRPDIAFTLNSFSKSSVSFCVGLYTPSEITISSPGLHMLMIAKTTALKPVGVKKTWYASSKPLSNFCN